MHAAAISPRGGVVRRAAQLRGQSIIEYVLIIAIVGLAVVFAGPQAAGAIRNEFETVVGAIESGTSGEEFQTEEEKGACLCKPKISFRVVDFRTEGRS